MATRIPKPARRMSARDAGFLYLERSHTQLHIGCVAIFESALSREDLIERIEERLPQLRRYAQRAMRVPFSLGHPSWEDDPGFRVEDHVTRWGLPTPGEGPPRLPCPPLAQVTGVFLNAIFLDHLDADLDHLTRMNEIVASGQRDLGARASEPIRSVTPLSIAPSEDLALVAQRFAHRMPRLLGFLLDGLGTPDAQSADLMSYLLFDAAYTRTLVELGHRDADARISEFEAFIRRAPLIEAAAANVRLARSGSRRAQFAVTGH